MDSCVDLQMLAVGLGVALAAAVDKTAVEKVIDLLH